MSALRWQFVLGSSLSSRLIAWWGNGYGGYSHVDLILPDGRCLGARDDKIGDCPPGVHIRNHNYEHWVKRTVVSLHATERETREAFEWACEQLGDEYDQEAILGFILGQERHTKGHWICSALQTGLLKHIGRFAKIPVPDSQVSPNSLLNMLCVIGGQIETHCNETSI